MTEVLPTITTVPHPSILPCSCAEDRPRGCRRHPIGCRRCPRSRQPPPQRHWTGPVRRRRLWGHSSRRQRGNRMVLPPPHLRWDLLRGCCCVPHCPVHRLVLLRVQHLRHLQLLPPVQAQHPRQRRRHHPWPSCLGWCGRHSSACCPLERCVAPALRSHGRPQPPELLHRVSLHCVRPHHQPGCPRPAGPLRPTPQQPIPLGVARDDFPSKVSRSFMDASCSRLGPTPPKKNTTKSPCPVHTNIISFYTLS